MRRLVLVGAGVAVGLYWLAHADLGHGAGGVPPRTVAAIKQTYPDLHAREVARTPTSWHRLRVMARERFARRNPCADWTLRRTIRLRGLAPGFERVWSCDDVVPGMRVFLRCIPSFEGGRPGVPWPASLDTPHRWNGGHVSATAPPPGRERNIVFGFWQVRPAWFRGERARLPGTYLPPDVWDAALVRWAADPLNQARTVEAIPPVNYATAGRCS